MPSGGVSFFPFLTRKSRGKTSRSPSKLSICSMPAHWTSPGKGKRRWEVGGIWSLADRCNYQGEARNSERRWALKTVLPSSVTRAGQKGRDASQGGKIGKCFQTGVVSCAGATENSNKDWKASIRLAGRWLTALALAVVMTNGNIKALKWIEKWKVIEIQIRTLHLWLVTQNNGGVTCFTTVLKTTGYLQGSNEIRPWPHSSQKSIRGKWKT